MRTKIKILMSLFVVLNFSCENLSDPGEIEIRNSVFINLMINSKQKFFIYKTIDFKTPTDFGYQLSDFDKYFVDDAIISLSDSLNTYENFIIERDSSDVRFYTLAQSENFRTDTKYSLSINSNGQNISGSTFTPGDFNIISPLDNEVISFSGNKFNIGIEWSKSKNAKGYVVNISYQYYDEYFNRYLQGSLGEIIFDTSYTYSSFAAPSDSVLILIMAFDENYYNHIFEGIDKSGINGAYGYFGSSVLQSRKIWVE